MCGPFTHPLLIRSLSLVKCQVTSTYYEATPRSGLVKLYNPFSVVRALEANNISYDEGVGGGENEELEAYLYTSTKKSKSYVSCKG